MNPKVNAIAGRSSVCTLLAASGMKKLKGENRKDES
jgi:16S rRNA C1402 (ribose-2'-O) methylase RsmI